MLRLPSSAADKPSRLAKYRDERAFDPLVPLNEEEELFKLEKLRINSKMAMLRSLYYWRQEEAPGRYPHYPEMVEAEAARILRDYVEQNPLGVGGGRARLPEFYGNLAAWKAALVVALRIMREHPEEDWPRPVPASPEDM